MFFAWGSGSENIDLGVVNTYQCDTCEKDRPFKLFLHYRYAHIWYLFSWISEKKYLLLCDVCHRGVEIDSKEVEPKLTRNPIPFQRQYGWTILIALIVIIIAFGLYENQKQQKLDYFYIESPQANDLYVIDFSKLQKELGQSSDYSYGIIRVKVIAGDLIELLPSKIVYSKLSGVDKDISTRKVYNNDYYSEEDPLFFQITDLRRMRDDNVINRVIRN